MSPIRSYTTHPSSLRLFFTAAVIISLLAACQPLPAPTSTQFPPTVTEAPSPTPAPSATRLPTGEVAATPTATQAPSPIPSLTATAAPIVNARLVRGPYLQNVTTSSIMIIWETDLPSPGSVEYSEGGSYSQRLDDPVTEKSHALTLSGLKPYTTYTYRVLNVNTPLSSGDSFRTAAGPDQNAFNFVVFGDTRTNAEVHQAVVDRIVQMKPDFVLHVGDMVGDGLLTSDWKTFFQVEQKLMAGAPLFPVLGNHENDAPMFFDAFYLPGNERWYTFEYGQARIIGLEIDGFQDIVDPLHKQYQWLEETLAQNTQPWVFVFFHIPLNTMQGFTPNSLDNILVPLFEKYKVTAVFSGHNHNYQRRIVNGITYVITGGGGAPLYDLQPGNTPPEAAAKEYHAIDIAIDGKILTAKVITPSGTELDRFTITLP